MPKLGTRLATLPCGMDAVTLTGCKAGSSFDA